jgi:hypothetical protein
MPTQLYATLLRQTQQLRPGERRTRVRTWTWLLTGLYLSRCVHLSRIAAKIPGAATLLSTTRRLSRLLDNAAVRVRPWYAPIVRTLLQRAARSGEIRLLVDGSKVSGGHQLLIVSLAYGRRALPLVWTWVRCPRGHSTAWKQRVLLGYVQRLVPPGARVLVVGDSEFGAIEVIQQLEAWGWFYVLRQKGSHLVDVTAATLTGPALPAVEAAANAAALELTQGGTAGTWRSLSSLIEKPGQRRWGTGVRLTAQHAHRTNLLLHWQPGESEPWLLATNLESAHAAWIGYRRRMWIEAMFGDFKGHGFDLESTHLRHVRRLARLVLAVALLYLWLVVYGAAVIQRGLRPLVDRADRRDYSLFRLGWNMVERCSSYPTVLKMSMILGLWRRFRPAHRTDQAIASLLAMDFCPQLAA